MTQGIVMRSFIGGEIAPPMYARADQAKYANGAALIQNFIVLRQGGVTKRPGLRFVAETKNSADAAKLRKFVFEGDDQTYVLEFGDEYIRFYYHEAQVVVSGVAAYAGGTTYAQGDLVVDGGVNYYSLVAGNVGHTPASSPTFWYPLTDDIYEVPTPYAVEDVPRIHVSQSADVLVLTHPLYPPYELQRVGHTHWNLVLLTTAPSIAAPSAGLTGTPGGAGVLNLDYVVTSVSASGEESYPSAVIHVVSAAAPTQAAPVSTGWTAVSGAARYNIYLDPTGNNGVFGYVGSATTNSFKDPGFQPDYTVQPPITATLFNATGGYPATSTYYQQRLWMGRTVNDPEINRASQVGSFHNFSISIPLQDDDAIEFRIASKHLNPVGHYVDGDTLILLTDEAAWAMVGDEAGVIRPTSISAKQIAGSAGSSLLVFPEVVDGTVIYAPFLGAGLRGLNFEQQQGGYVPTDLSLLASHLFERQTLTEIAYARTPHSVLWAVTSAGWLLGLTYVKEQDVWAWHRHRTTAASGLFESIVAVPDANSANQDVLYAIVKRTINGSTKRYIEAMERTFNSDYDSIEDAFYVDAGLTYDGAAATVMSGLDHLEGEQVAVLADGNVVADGTDPDFTVASGAITLPDAASVVQIGLPIQNADVITLDLDVEGTDLRGKKKRIPNVGALVAGSRVDGLLVGPNEAGLLRYKANPWETATALKTGLLDINITDQWDDQGRIWFRHADPTPMTLLGLIPQVGVGG